MKKGGQPIIGCNQLNGRIPDIFRRPHVVVAGIYIGFIFRFIVSQMFFILFILLIIPSGFSVVPEWELVGHCGGCKYCLMLHGLVFIFDRIFYPLFFRYDVPHFCIFNISDIPCWLRQRLGGRMAQTCSPVCDCCCGNCWAKNFLKERLWRETG